MRELWKFYCSHQDVTIDQLSPASRNTYLACHRAFMKLPPSERDIITDYFTTDQADKSALTRFYEQKHRLTPEYINETVRKSCRLAALELGLADEKESD